MLLPCYNDNFISNITNHYKQCYLSSWTVAHHAKTVLQSPDDLLKNQNELAVIVSTYTIILWYKQTQTNHEFTLLGYIWNKNYFPEDNFSKKIKLDGDGTKNGSLKILQLEASDSAMYYCAASFHSVMSSYATIQKALKAAVLHN
uniref:Immunoglobulin V-set domain-containing protein n=1 Tax=Sinocyclocheilus grahami TaxID=75366 RepID=A0A672MXF5_SINGR